MSDETRRARVPLSKVRTEGTQARAETYDIAEMAAEMRDEGNVRVPIRVCFDGTDYWVWDGHHRVAAARAAGLTHVSAEIRTGVQRDARLAALGANAEHGRRRTHADKRRAVSIALEDSEWGVRSDNWIAQHCRVSDKTVAAVRADFGIPKSARVIGRDGRVMDTTHVGRKPSAPEPPPELSVARQLEIPAEAYVTLTADDDPADDLLADEVEPDAPDTPAPPPALSAVQRALVDVRPTPAFEAQPAQAKAALIIALRDAVAAVRAHVDALPASIRREVVAGVEDAALEAVMALKDLLLPDGSATAAKARVALSVISGGRQA